MQTAVPCFFLVLQGVQSTGLFELSCATCARAISPGIVEKTLAKCDKAWISQCRFQNVSEEGNKELPQVLDLDAEDVRNLEFDFLGHVESIEVWHSMSRLQERALEYNESFHNNSKLSSELRKFLVGQLVPAAGVALQAGKILMDKLVGEQLQENIEDISMNISKILSKSDHFAHTFVVFKSSDGYWYSIDKECDAIEARKSIDKELLITSQVSGARILPRPSAFYTNQIIEPGTVKTTDIRKFLSGQLSHTYNFVTADAQVFVKELYTFLGLTSTFPLDMRDLKEALQSSIWGKQPEL